jgi:transcription initiation factor TFIID subunit TAF12
MRNLPLAAFALLLSFCSNTLFAQNTSNSIGTHSGSNTIKSSNNGKLNYSYRKLANNHFSIEVIFKNDQFIYKQEIDTLQIHSAEAFTLFKQDLQNALTALQNANSNFKIERSNYFLSCNDTGVSGLFVVLTNKAGNINTANTKFQIKVLLEWLNTIEFGKS